MTIPNRIPLDDLPRMAVGDIATLPAAQLAMLQDDAGEALRRAKMLCEWLDGAVARRYEQRAIAARGAAGKDSGTVRFDDGPVTVVVDLPKKVEWDQTRLAALVDRIRADGEDPTEYVEISFKVPERKYAAWPTHIRTAFLSARTVRVGKPSFKLTLNTEGV